MKTFKILPRLFAIFGLMMMFAVSGWGESPDIGNTCATAAVVTPTSTTSSLAINTTTDIDYFKIVLTEAGTLNVSSTSATRDTVGRLYNSACTQIDSDTGNNNFSISSSLSAGTYYVSVEDQDNQTLNYNLVSAFTLSNPEIRIQGNGTTITDGDTTPSTNDDTDFGSTAVGSGIIDKTFTIRNTDNNDILTIGAITFSGTNAADFTVLTAPASSVAANNGETTFTIRFTPSAAGVRNATISIVNNDQNENPYNFSIRGTGVVPNANLALTNTDAPDPVIINQSLVYTLNVTNNGPNTATDLNLTDTLPSGVIYQSAIGTGWSCSQASGVVTCTNPSLANGASSSVAITVTAPAASGTITNTATVTSAVTDPTPANNTNIAQLTTVNPPNADLALTKTAPASVMVGNIIQYTISITNNGPNGTDLNMTDVLNANLTYINAYDDAHEWICAYTSANRTVSCQHPNVLANGATSTITILATAPNSAMTVPNTASVIGTVQDPNLTNNTGSASISVTASSFTNSNPRNFTLQKQYNINGNMKVIGNTIMQDAATHTCAAAGVTNNSITVEYVDKDTNASTFNSTSANVTLPTGTTSSDIVWAGLYWQGYYVGTTDAIKTNTKNVLLKAPGGSYAAIQSDSAKFNWVYFDDAKTRWYYQGGQDVTSYVKSGLSGTYTVANVSSQTGGSIDGGGFGAWALMILYKDQSATLKNMSVYDGYVGISSSDAGRTGVYANTIVPLGGFFTPTSGNVNSEFMSFVGEGDIGIAGDFGSLSNSTGDIKLKNSLNPNDNLFNATISDKGVAVTARNPQCPNNIGIDIDTFDVGSTAATPATQGQIIQNGQTTTNVKLSSSGDGYFPGLFAFSTDLYVPDVCYLEDVTFNGLSIGGTNIPTINDIVDYEVSVTNKDNEPALGVYIEKIFDKPDEITYVPGSMNIAPIPGTTYPANNKTDARGDDTAEYYTDTNTSKLLLGTGATWYEGGVIARDALTKFKYQAKIGDQNASENIYLVSYHNDLLRIAFHGLPIRKCADFNNSFAVLLPTPGKFNAVMPGRVTDGNDDGNPYSENRLLTQITNKNFSLDILSLADNLSTVETSYKGLVQVEFVTPPYDTCSNAPLLALSPTLYAAFSNPSIGGRANAVTSAGSTSFSIPTAATNTAARIKYVVNNSNVPASWSCVDNTYNCIWGMLVSTFGNNTNTPCRTECNPAGPAPQDPASAECVACVFGPSHTESSCSKDVFAIRPDQITIDTNETRLVGGKWYQYDMKAVQYGLTTTASTGYTQAIDNTADKNGSTELVVPAGCTLLPGKELFNQNVPFSDGFGMVALRYMNVGDVKVELSDQNWATVDRNLTSPSDSDCVEGSWSNIADANGKVGCMVHGSKLVTFAPARFDGNVSGNSWMNFNNGSFTYLSSDQNMSARLTLTTKALIEDGAIATNYTHNCFAKDVNTTVTLMDHPIPDLTTVNTHTGALNRIMMFGNNDTAQLLSLTPPNAIFRTSEGNFTNGSASLFVDINFDRNATIAENPFNISLSDFNVSYVDTNGTSGNDFNRDNDMNGTFVYGRVISRDVRIFGSGGFSANGWYEVYNAQSLGGTALKPSRNENMWYINALHNDTSNGDANVTMVITPNNTSFYGNNGIETYMFNGLAIGGYKEHIDTAPWLWYGINALQYLDPSAGNTNCLTHPCFNINVVPQVGATGSAKTQSEADKKANKATTTTPTGGTGLIYDYAPAIK